MKSEKPNGTPACAGVTALFEGKSLNKNRHARAGGHPIFCSFDKSWGGEVLIWKELPR
jgi:hypothetical protein